MWKNTFILRCIQDNPYNSVHQVQAAEHMCVCGSMAGSPCTVAVPVLFENKNKL
jgi:hypothetical protein